MAIPTAKPSSATVGTSKGLWSIGPEEKKYLKETYDEMGGPFKLPLQSAKDLFNYKGSASLIGAVVQRMNKTLEDNKVPFKAGADDKGQSIKFFAHSWPIKDEKPMKEIPKPSHDSKIPPKK